MMRLTFVGLLVLGACSVLPEPKPARYRTMVLDVEPAPAVAKAAPARTATVALRAVELPTYLDTDRVVTRAGDNEIRYSKDDRWGEPLAAAIPRILAADLEARLASDGLELRPAGSPVATWVEVTIQRFEADDSGRIELRARWTIHEREANVQVKRGAVRLVDTHGGTSAAGMSRLLPKLGEAIAADLHEDLVVVRDP